MQTQSSNNHDELFHLLKILCDKTIDEVILHRDKGKLEKILYQKLPVKDVNYVMETYCYDWQNIEYFDYYDWTSEEAISFEQHFFSFTEFEEAAKKIIDEFQVPEHETKRIGLASLLRLIMYNTPNGHITHENLEQYIQLFIDGYESHRKKLPLDWNIQLSLGNISIESDEIEIAPNVFLRRPSKEQLAEIKPKPNHIDEHERFFGRQLIIGAILSFTVKSGKSPVTGLYPKEIPIEIEKWLNTFRLLKPTDITVVSQSISPISIFEHGISENKEKPQDKFWQGKIEHQDTSSFKLYLKKSEEKHLKSCVHNLTPALKGISHTNYLTGNSHDLAFHRYNDSLMKSEVNAYKILSSITSLESLLSDGSTEITFKIRMRVAKLLSFFDFDSLYVSEKMRDAYSLRSKLVHGAKPEEKKKDLLEFARNHTHEILNYNRICLLVALQLKQKMNKDELIKLIDCSFIDKTSHENLKNLIEEEVKIPIVNPFLKIENELKTETDMAG